MPNPNITDCYLFWQAIINEVSKHLDTLTEKLKNLLLV